LQDQHGSALLQVPYTVQQSRYQEAFTRLLYKLVVLRSSIIIALLLWATALSGHEMTPAYPILKPSHVAGVVKAQMKLFNRRQDIKYYQIEVFDKDFVNIRFSSPYRIMKVEYQESKDFDVYIRKSDLIRAVYICTISKVIKSRTSQTLISSRICSKISDGVA